MASSPVSSPSRKKQRLSSPTYEDEFDLLDGEDFRTLDEIEYKLSQKFNSSPPFKESSDYNASRDASSLVPVKPIFDITRGEVRCISPSRKSNTTRASQKTHELQPQRPTYSPYARSQGSTSSPPYGPNQADDRQPSSPEGYVEKDYGSWFLPSKEEQPVVFSSAFALLTRERETQEDELSTELSYQSDSVKESWTNPRPETLEAVKKKLQSWEHDDPDDIVAAGRSDAFMPSQATSADRKPFNDVRNSSASQVTAIHVIPSELSLTSQQPHVMKKSLQNGPLNPLLSRTSAALSGSTFLDSSPATPGRLPTQVPSSFSASHKRRSLGLAPRSPFNSSLTRPKFKTPFKTGLSATNTGSDSPSYHAKLPHNSLSDAGNHSAQQVPTTAAQLPLNDGFAGLRQQTDNTKSAIIRPTLATYGLIPQTYDREELDAMGVPSTLFILKDVSDFLYYRFNPINSDVPTEGELNADTAFRELQRTEHHLATKAWVDNHWCLILWKLSGMACLDPEKLAKIWCWKEVMRQLRFRYEKEFVAGSRSPLNLITSRDTSITRPIVLCVSDISWPAQQGDPELELTDGWYRIRAKTDKSIARAVQRNIIRTGRKLVCICTKLETPRNEPMDILGSYGRAFLSLCGNSTHLAAWHTKLGFLKTRCIATLNSLSADGGRIPVMDIVVTDVYPIGYIEFVPSANGDIREGPRTESEEAIEEEKWRNKREQEAMKLREEFEQKLARLEGYADAFERRAGAMFPPSEDDSAPNHVETIVDELVEGDNEAPILQNVKKEEAAWLCILLRQRCLAEREQAGVLIERELETLAPPRRVCNFRILRVKDARTLKRPPTRTAQLTVWDANALQRSSDGIEGDIKPGKRYLVTNLIPTQQAAWMGTEPGAEIFLSTGKNSRWQSAK